MPSGVTDKYHHVDQRYTTNLETHVSTDIAFLKIKHQYVIVRYGKELPEGLKKFLR